MSHLLHSEVSKQINLISGKYSNLIVYCDPACGGAQNLPFFLPGDPSNVTEITNVDLMITKNDKVVFVCEIEESDRTPIRIYGKFFTLLSSDFCKTVHKRTKKDTKFPFADKCIFLQVVSNKNWTAKSKNGTILSKKIPQLAEIKTSIISTLSSSSHFKFEYHLLTGDVSSFAPNSPNTNVISDLIATL